jgi:Haem-binding domain/Cytochrome P460
VFDAIQFTRPSLDNPPVTAEIQASPEIRHILRNACYNCHSNETKLLWFDLNFSEIGQLPPAAQRAALIEALNMIQLGAMPLPSYRRVHPIQPSLRNNSPCSGTTSIPSAQHPQPALNRPPQATPASFSVTDPKSTVQPDFNGVPFFPDYKSWRTVSVTDRGDNHTMRAILGSDVAIHPLETKQVQAWLDGAIFAKTAWEKLADDQDAVHLGRSR